MKCTIMTIHCFSNIIGDTYPLFLHPCHLQVPLFSWVAVLHSLQPPLLQKENRVYSTIVWVPNELWPMQTRPSALVFLFFVVCFVAPVSIFLLLLPPLVLGFLAFFACFASSGSVNSFKTLWPRGIVLENRPIKASGGILPGRSNLIASGVEQIERNWEFTAKSENYKICVNFGRKKQCKNRSIPTTTGWCLSLCVWHVHACALFLPPTFGGKTVSWDPVWWSLCFILCFAYRLALKIFWSVCGVKDEFWR